MVDLKLFESILKRKGEPKYIDSDDYISRDLVILFCSTGKMATAYSLFKIVHRIDGNFPKYKVWHHCIQCEKNYDEWISKSGLFRYLLLFRKLYYDKDIKLQEKRDIKEYFVCKDCQKKERKEKEKEEKEQEKQEHITINENTEYYIRNYLNLNRVWEKSISQYRRVQIICNPSNNLDHNRIADYIKNMEYSDFLKTLYWKTIAQHVKYKANYKCRLCSNTEKLNAHHNTYTGHGYEHIDWKEDLICTCKDCYEKHHEIAV